MGAVLLVDCGNSSLRFAVANGTKIKTIWSGSSSTLGARAEHPAHATIARTRGIEGACIACGREAWRPALSRIFSRAGNVPCAFFVSQDGPLPLRVKYRRGATAGPDRIANAAALRYLVSTHAFSVDTGTATNIEVLGPDGDFEGGAILPGAEASLRALTDATAGRLPALKPTLPTSALGRTTVECLLSGGVLGHVLAIEGLIRTMMEEDPEMQEAPVFLTGGLAKTLAPAFAIPVRVEPMLTFIGLLEIWNTVGHEAASPVPKRRK